MAQETPAARDLVWPILRRTTMEIGPVILFVVVFAWLGMLWATAAFMAAVALSAATSYLKTGRLPVVPAAGFVIVAVFGGLTLVYTEAAFIKVRPTIANGIYAAAVAGGMLAGRNFLKRAFTPEIRLSERGWRRLAWRLAGFLTVLALGNEAVRLSFDTGTWVAYKAFSVIVLNSAFALSQIPLLRAEWSPHAADGDDADAGAAACAGRASGSAA